MPPIDLSLGLEGTHVLVTGGTGLIGSVVVRAFLAAGSDVSVIDIAHPQPGQFDDPGGPGRYHYVEANISRAESIDAAFTAAEAKYGPVECCIALASLDLSSLPRTESLCDFEEGEWRRVFEVNLHGTFLTARRWLQGLRRACHGDEDSPKVKVKKLRNVSLILMGSESGKFGVRECAAYAAGKAAVQYGLLPSLAKDAPRVYLKARVNAIAPGAVDTARFREECAEFGKRWEWEECEATVGLGRAVPTEDVARAFVGLASERWSGTVHGQVLHVDGGKMGSLMWQQGELDGRRRRGSGVERVEG